MVSEDRPETHGRRMEKLARLQLEEERRHNQVEEEHLQGQNEERANLTVALWSLEEAQRELAQALRDSLCT